MPSDIHEWMPRITLKCKKCGTGNELLWSPYEQAYIYGSVTVYRHNEKS